jgi:branched-chain amino acid transport system permease protein
MASAIVSILGVPLYYVESGSGPAILYIHGNTGSSLWFSRVMYIPGYRTIALDMPNFGRSGRLDPSQAPDASDIHLYADYVAAFIDQLGLEKPLVVAHSLGGAVAMSMAGRYPERIGALMLVDSSAPTGLQTPEDRHPLIEMMRTNPAILKAALASVVPALQDPEFLDELVADALLMNPASFIGNAKALTRFDCTSLCPNYQGPVMVMRGAKDVITTEAMAEATVAAFPGAELVSLQNIGHSPMVEDSAGFLGHVAGFAMRSLSAPAAAPARP